MDSAYPKMNRRGPPRPNEETYPECEQIQNSQRRVCLMIEHSNSKPELLGSNLGHYNARRAQKSHISYSSIMAVSTF